MKHILTLFFILMILLAGCAPAASKNNETPSVSPTPRPSKTFTPSPSSSPSPTSSFTLTATPTVTPSPTFSTDFSGANISGVSYQSGWKYFYIAVDVKEAISGEYYATIEGVSYTCRTFAGQPRRLVCNGPSVAVERWLTLKIFEKSTERLVYESEFMAPLSAVIPTEWYKEDE